VLPGGDHLVDLIHRSGPVSGDRPIEAQVAEVRGICRTIAICAVNASGAAAGWQTIDTVPSDARSIIAWDDESVGEAFWSGDRWGWLKTALASATPDMRPAITHWIPLPKPPREC
jgi:hypothetical protein